MSIVLNLKISQTDYTAAFVHAPTDCLVYVEAPVRFRTRIGVIDYGWRLNKSLYGLCQSPFNYFLYTKEKLNPKDLFVQSIADPCFFMSAEVICLLYVYIVLLFYKNKLSMKAPK